jgi:ElaB/YqjD/DUF883 family membrane-anchored ribosome-binding protein
MSTKSAKLANDINVLVRDAEQLVKATATETSYKVIELRQRVQRTADDIKTHIGKMETAVIDLTAPAAMAADRYVHAHPWPAIGVSALAGLLIGLLASRN